MIEHFLFSLIFLLFYETQEVRERGRQRKRQRQTEIETVRLSDAHFHNIGNNKAGYTAQDAPSTRLKITRDRRTYGPTDLRTDGHTLI